MGSSRDRSFEEAASAHAAAEAVVALSPMTLMTSLIERRDELSEIERSLREACGGAGSVTLLDAPSGAGKTALINEATTRASHAGCVVMAVCGSELESGYPFGSVLNLIDSRATTGSLPHGEELLVGQARLAAPLFNGADSTNIVAAGDEFAIIHGLYWWIVNLCDTAPVALIVDDAHLCDDPSLRFVNYLAARLEDLPVALFLAVRSGDVRANAPLITHLGRLEKVNTMHPPALTQAAVGTLLRLEAPDLVLTTDAVRRCWMITGGNPFLVSELSTTIRTEGRQWLDDNLDRLESFAPVTVRSRVLMRLKRLGDDALRLARAYAVLRDSAPLTSAAQVAAMTLDQAVPLLDLLDEAHIIKGGAQAHFRHPMIRSAVYEAIPPSLLAATHLRAAQLLRQTGESVELVARHLLLGMPETDVWAVDVLTEAAAAASRKGSPDTAIRYLRHVVALPLPDERRITSLVDLGLLEAGRGDTESGVEHLEQALALMQDPIDQARCLYALGSTLYRFGRHSQAAEAFERSASLAQGVDPDLALEAEGAWIFASYYLDQVLPRAMVRLGELTTDMTLATQQSPARRVILAIAGLRAVMSRPPADGGAAMAIEAVRDGPLLEQQTFASVAVNLAVLALVFANRLDEASAIVDQVISAARHRQHVPITSEASFIRAIVDYAAGDITEAWMNAQTAVDGIAGGWYGLAPMAQGTLVQCLLERDDLDTAEIVLENAEKIPLTTDSQGLWSWIYMARARVEAARGNYQNALEGYLATGRTLSLFEAKNPSILRWRSGAGLAAKALGDEAMALELIGEEIRLGEDFQLPRVIGHAVRADAMLLDRRARIARLEESLELFEKHGTALDLSETLLDLGRAMRQSGSRLESRTPLKRSMELAHRQGAFATAREARAELLASGAKPRRTYGTGLHGLTPTELRIAEMAAQGLTNREVAESMFLAKSTVAWHLRHVFQKLGIESRADLPEAIDATRAGRPR